MPPSKNGGKQQKQSAKPSPKAKPVHTAQKHKGKTGTGRKSKGRTAALVPASGTKKRRYGNKTVVHKMVVHVNKKKRTGGRKTTKQTMPVETASFLHAFSPMSLAEGFDRAGAGLRIPLCAPTVARMVTEHRDAGLYESARLGILDACYREEVD